MTPVASFRADFEDALSTLREALPKTQVYVASVPDLKRLWSEGRSNPLGKQMWKLGICPSMLGDADALDSAATRAAGRRCRSGWRRTTRCCGRCARRTAVPLRRGRGVRLPLRTGQLSHWDWFHPSRDGQARLAEMAYRVVTAAEPPR